MLAFLCCIFVYLIYVISVVCVWLCPSHILFTLLVLFVCGGVQHILVFCVVFLFILFTLFVLFVCGCVQHISYLPY